MNRRHSDGPPARPARPFGGSGEPPPVAQLTSGRDGDRGLAEPDRWGQGLARPVHGLARLHRGVADRRDALACWDLITGDTPAGDLVDDEGLTEEFSIRELDVQLLTLGAA